MSFKWLLGALKGSRAKMVTSAKKRINIHHYTSSKKNRHRKLKRFFFIANYIPSRVFRGFEQLSSSI